jgi:peroxiredoxin/predicted 2-oxoglutarate/Fe(II)-dependent dioxygenase YbiX
MVPIHDSGTVMSSAKRLLQYGEPAPWFVARSTVNHAFNFDTVAGRYIVLCFFGCASHPFAARVLAGFQQASGTFDGDNAALFGVSIDPSDESTGRIAAVAPSAICFWDSDQAVCRAFGLQVDNGIRPHTFLLDPRLRVIGRWTFDGEPEAHVAEILQTLAAQPPMGTAAPAQVQAPILIAPRIFEPELCRTLMKYYDDRGGKDSGFMRDEGGKTVGVYDYSHKRRRDQEIEDAALRAGCMHRIHDRLIPEIHKAYQFRATRMERYIVACYEAETGGHFRAHRDNTTKGTAHRRFAVSLILNTGEFEGGLLRFPEFGPHLYSAPAGGAVVFSCSLLHEATPVTRGKRYVFLPFLYDDEAARIRQENERFLAGDVNKPESGA